MTFDLFPSHTAQVSAVTPPLQITYTNLLQLLNISPDALLAVNAAGNIVVANEQVATLFGYEREELIGQSVEILLPPRFRASHYHHRQHYFAAPQTRPMGAGLPLYGQRKNGTIFPVDISLKPLLLDQVLHAVGAIRDMTEQKALEEQLQQRNAELDQQYRNLQKATHLQEEAHINELVLREINQRMYEFLNIASHELRTPLTVVKGTVQLALRQLQRFAKHHELIDHLPQLQEMLEEVTVQTRVLDRLVGDLLDTSRSYSNPLTMHLAPDDLHTLLLQAIEEQYKITPERVIYLERNYRHPLPVYVDAYRLKQVILNYLSNALKYSPLDSPVEVQVELEENQVRLSFHDFGVGIAEEDLPRVWERFYRAQSAQTQSGMGVGLYLCRMIITSHGGSVGVQSVPSVRTTFWLTLPLLL